MPFNSWLAAGKKMGRIPLLLSKLSAKLRGRDLEGPQAPPASSSFINPKFVFKVILIAGLAAGWQYYFSWRYNRSFQCTIRAKGKHSVAEVREKGLCVSFWAIVHFVLVFKTLNHFYNFPENVKILTDLLFCKIILLWVSSSVGVMA